MGRRASILDDAAVGGRKKRDEARRGVGRAGPGREQGDVRAAEGTAGAGRCETSEGSRRRRVAEWASGGSGAGAAVRAGSALAGVRVGDAALRGAERPLARRVADLGYSMYESAGSVGTLRDRLRPSRPGTDGAPGGAGYSGGCTGRRRGRRRPGRGGRPGGSRRSGDGGGGRKTPGEGTAATDEERGSRGGEPPAASGGGTGEALSAGRRRSRGAGRTGRTGEK